MKIEQRKKGKGQRNTDAIIKSALYVRRVAFKNFAVNIIVNNTGTRCTCTNETYNLRLNAGAISPRRSISTEGPIPMPLLTKLLNFRMVG